MPTDTRTARSPPEGRSNNGCSAQAHSTVAASVNSDGTVSLVEGSTDIGGTRASIAMQLAEALGIRAEDVRPSVADTDSVGYTDVTGGSRVAYATGWAAYEAAQDIKKDPKLAHASSKTMAPGVWRGCVEPCAASAPSAKGASIVLSPPATRRSDNQFMSWLVECEDRLVGNL